MKIKVEITEVELKTLVKEHMKESFNGDFDETKVNIFVKSKQNYKSEWEVASFKAEYEGEV